MKLKLFLLTLLGCSSFVFSLNTASAAIQLPTELKPNNLPEIVTQAEPTSEDHPETAATQTLILFAGKLLSRVLLFVGAIAVISMMVSASHFILGFGQDARVTKGKNGMFWAVVGLIIILTSYAIVQGVLSILLQVDSSLG